MIRIGPLPKRRAQARTGSRDAELPTGGRQTMRNSLDPTPEDFERLFRAASGSGAQAAAAVTPPLMTVTDPDRIHLPAGLDRVQGLWFVPEGPAGMAMIVIHPATCRFARWLLQQGHAHRVYGRRGAIVYAEADGQSMRRAAAYAMAFVSAIAHEPLGVSAEIVLRYG